MSGKSLLLAAILFSACVSPQIIKPNPALSARKGTIHQSKSPEKPIDTSTSENEIDFSEAFDTSVADTTTATGSVASTRKQVFSAAGGKAEPAFFVVPSKMVRIVLKQNFKRVVVYSVGTAALRYGQFENKERLRGRILFEIDPAAGKVMVKAGNTVNEASIPCTLVSDNAYNFLEIDDNTYRGAIIITASPSGGITLVNFIEVEDYLRGVVPLEMGKRPREEIEALKAQAVACRTYAYYRMIQRREEPFDMVATVVDQIYGGVAAECRESDLAIRSTADLVMTDGDGIIAAYYHSTCGGMTAGVDEAFGKPPCSYLRPIRDCDESGKAWCRASAYFSWEEKWPWKQFSDIVMESLRKIDPQYGFKGVVNSLKVEERYACGRVKRATIRGSGWYYECGGDRIRHILRRCTAGNPILRSSNFTVVSMEGNIVRLSGKGYGHGVGMCQMGAIGRAQAGQDFETILKSYYSGISIVKAKPDEKRGG